MQTITRLTLNAQKPRGGMLWAVIMTAAFLGCQPSGGAPREALKSQSATTIAARPDAARGNKRQPGPPEKLYGTWIAKDVDAKMGEVKVKLTFREEGPVKLLAWSDIPFVGKVKDLKGPYEVHGDTISSKAIRGGTKAKYSFEGEQLVLQFEGGKVVRFRRE